MLYVIWGEALFLLLISKEKIAGILGACEIYWWRLVGQELYGDSRAIKLWESLNFLTEKKRKQTVKERKPRSS